jgi:hypothetical protein
LQNFAQLDEQVIYFTTNEKVQKRNTDRLPIPQTLGQLIQLFINKYRPVLAKKDNAILSCWLTKAGNPLSKMSSFNSGQKLNNFHFVQVTEV